MSRMRIYLWLVIFIDKSLFYDILGARDNLRGPMNTLVFLSPLLFVILSVVFIFIRSRFRKEEDVAIPVTMMPPPVRKTWVDLQVEGLVNNVLQSVQHHPEKWTTWGVYKKGFGDKVTNFECSGNKMGVVIGPKGCLKYHAFRQATVEEKEEKQACWFEVPLSDFDRERLQEAFIWLATTKSLTFLDKETPSKHLKADAPLAT